MIVTSFPPQSYIANLRNETNDTNLVNKVWPNVVVNVESTNYSKYVTESSFSIFTNNFGTSNLLIGNRSVAVCEQTLLTINPYQKLEYSIKSDMPVRTFNIHFNFNFYIQALNALLSSNDTLLENVDNNNSKSYELKNYLQYRNSGINKVFNSFNEFDTDSWLLNVLNEIYLNDLKFRNQLYKVNSVKAATKKELFARMVAARDIIFSCYNIPELSVEYISNEVAMSRFHFLRVFKQVFSCSPYSYLKLVRLEKAKYLLETTDLTISEIAFKVGFNEPNSIYPLLKASLKSKPTAYRNKISKNE